VAPELGAFVGGVVQAVLVTGTHSFYKNAIKPLLLPLITGIASKLFGRRDGN
jgi:hypothetical protein